MASRDPGLAPFSREAPDIFVRRLDLKDVPPRG